MTFFSSYLFFVGNVLFTEPFIILCHPLKTLKAFPKVCFLSFFFDLQFCRFFKFSVSSFKFICSANASFFLLPVYYLITNASFFLLNQIISIVFCSISIILFKSNLSFSDKKSLKNKFAADFWSVSKRYSLILFSISFAYFSAASSIVLVFLRLFLKENK